MAGSRSDQIPVHAVHVPVEAAGELAANGTSTSSSEGRGCMKDPTDKPLENPWKNRSFSDCNRSSIQIVVLYSK